MKNSFIAQIILTLVLVAAILTFTSKPQVVGKLPAGQDAEMYDFIINNFVGGGPEKDDIPAIDNPIYISGDEAERSGHVTDDEPVFGLIFEGEVYAYPQNIMYWHEIVNEEIKGKKVSVTYCPLTGSVIGFLGKNLGVSGKLYNSNLVMYDRETDDRIPQILGKGVEGELRGIELEQYPITVTTWKQWKEKHPDTKVLSRQTGAIRDYHRSPYPGYDDVLRVWFPLAAKSDLYESKEWVFGIENNGDYIAVQKSAIANVGTDTIRLGGEKVELVYDKKIDALHAYANGVELPAIQVNWFAWYAYYPQTKVWQPK